MPLHLQDKVSRTDIRVRITALFFAFKFFARKVFAQFRYLTALVQISCGFCNIDYSADVILIVKFPDMVKHDCAIMQALNSAKTRVECL